MRVWSGILGLAALVLTGGSGPVWGQGCTGDCDGDGAVFVNELIQGVTIALGDAPTSSCPSFDASGDDAVTVEELVSAVSYALDGCPLLPTPTPTMVATPTPVAASLYITTAVGNGVAGLNGDGLPPRQTALYLPQDVTVGPDGRIYFADWNNHRIRRVLEGTVPLVETVTGTGELGDAQDGPALEVKYNHPTNIDFDAEGRMVIAAWHNSLVKRLDFETGLVTNLCGTGARTFSGDGGPGNEADLDLPSSVAVAPDGSIYISDQANFRIRRLGTNGIIDTVCGTGTQGYSGDGGHCRDAELDSPVGQAAPPAGRIDMDAEGRIYIADTGNHVVRMVDLDRTIRTIAGTGEPGYSGDGGPATAAELDTPSDVAVASDGSIYVADTMNDVIRRIAPDGTITTIAGNGERGFTGDGGFATDARLNRPYGIGIGTAGRIYVADTHNHRIRLLTLEEPEDVDPGPGEGEVDIVPCTNEVGSICTYVGNGQHGFNGDGRDRLETTLYWPYDIEHTASGRIYVADWNNHRVREILPDRTLRTVIGTDFLGDGPPDHSDLTEPGAPGTTVDLNHPTDVQELPDGDLMLMAWHNHKIRVLDPETGLVRVVMGGPASFGGDGGPAKDALVNQPPHGTLDDDGNLFIVDQRNQRLRVVYDFATQREDGIVQTVLGTGEPGFNGDGPALETQVNFPTGGNPEPSGGIAFDDRGRLYFADTLNHRIRRVDFSTPDFRNGTVTTIAGTGEPGFSGDGGAATAAQINLPQDLEIGPDGNLYFADTDNHRVRRIDLDTGIIDTVAGTGERGYSGDGGPASEAQLSRPFGVAFDANGDLYVSDTFNGRIRRVKLTDTPVVPDPIFPADYADSYVEVRDCRFSIEHGGVYIRVLASPGAATAYLNEENPMPAHSVVIKEEYESSDCAPESLIGWRVMRKEEAGFDPEHGDWSWQKLDTDRGIIFDTKATCIGCHLTPECVERDFMCTVETGLPDELGLVVEDLPGALLSISGTSATNVIAVGADPGDGTGPLVLEYDGRVWRRRRTGASGDLWWITDRPVDGSFYMSGDGGLILRYDLFTREFEQYETPGDELMFGIWGQSSDNLWAVGGDLSNEDEGGVIWHFDGESWQVDDEIQKYEDGSTGGGGHRPDEGVPTLYKVWGRDDDEIYAAGRLGFVLRFDGIHWLEAPTESNRSLFTVHGNESVAAATGGFFDGVILELERGRFVDVTPGGLPQMNGVFVSEGERALAVGISGGYALRSAGGWERRRVDTPLDFHAAWIDPSGGMWAVGGDLTVTLGDGMIAYAGRDTVRGDVITEAGCATGVFQGMPSVSYSNEIVPLFERAGCLDSTCHGGLFPSSGYDLRFYETTFGPGVEAADFGECNVVPGDPDASYLMEKLMPSPRFGVQMPNGRPPLAEQDIDLIRQWILAGAPNDMASPTPTPSPTAHATPTPQPMEECDTDGVICTVAGTGRAQFDGDGPALQHSFYYPLDVAFGPDGLAVIVDWNNLRIRRLTAGGDLITIMGLGFEAAPEDGALAINSPLHHASDIEFDAAGNMLVAGNHVPLVFSVDTEGRVHIIAGTNEFRYDGDGGPARDASLITPFHALPDGQGGIYISDVDASVIRWIDPEGIIHTVAGLGDYGYSGDGGPATEAALNGPTRMRLAADGSLYVCDTGNHVIRRIVPDGTITTVAGSGAPGYAGDDGPATEGELSAPYDVRFDPAGNMYIADSGNDVIRRVDSSGTITTVIGLPGGGFSGDRGQAAGARLNRPSSITFDADGSLWISDTLNQRVRKVTGFLE